MSKIKFKQTGKRVATVVFEVRVPAGITNDDVLKALSDLVDVGLADARSTVDDEDLDHTDAERALRLDIGPPTLVGVK